MPPMGKTVRLEGLLESEGDVEEALVALDLQDDWGAGGKRFQGVAESLQSGHRFAIQGANDIAGVKGNIA